jgi:hypothetical protein
MTGPPSNARACRRWWDAVLTHRRTGQAFHLDECVWEAARDRGVEGEVGDLERKAQRLVDRLGAQIARQGQNSLWHTRQRLSGE